MKLQNKDYANAEPVKEDEICVEDIAAEFMVALGSILVFLGVILFAASW